ncbi:MAG: hypothetical protein HYW24_03015 [Candidatus Aenigmarchaeota archaeon]|nr:hypothetical protein [Candidatus Aenigmarchaeota archaeon]
MKNPQVELPLGKRYLVNVGEALDDSMKLSLLRQLHERQSARISYILKDDDKAVGTGFINIHDASPIAEVDAIKFDIPVGYKTYLITPPTIDALRELEHQRGIPYTQFPRRVVEGRMQVDVPHLLPSVSTVRTLQKSDNNFLTIDAVYFLGPFLSSPNWHPGNTVTRNGNGSIDSRLLFVLGYAGRNLYGSRGVYTPHSEDDGIRYRFWSPLGPPSTEPRDEYPLSIENEQRFNLIDNLVVGIRETRWPVRLNAKELYGELLSAQSL